MRLFLSIMTIISFLLSACSGEDKTMLRQADAVMEEHPDSALAILQCINRNSLSNGDLPYYALLMTQAQIKNDIDVSSDSLISKAFAKYGDDWRGDKGIRSNYYMGEILFNQEKNRDAMKYYLSAYEESKRLGNAYWHAKAAERIADLFFFAYNLKESAKYRKEAIALYEASELTLYKIRAEAKLTRINESYGKITERLQFQDSLLSTGYQQSTLDSLLIAFTEENSLSPLIAVGKIHGLDLVSDMLSAALPDKEKLDGAILVGNVLRQENNIKESDSILLKAKKYVRSDEGQIKILFALYQNARKQNN